MSSAELDQLIAQVTDAFRGVSRSGGVSLREAEVIDEYGTDLARQEAGLQDTDRFWTDISLNDLHEHGYGIGGLNFFDPIGWRYHLPAYITQALQNLSQDERAWDILESAEFAVSSPKDSFTKPRYSLLNLDQRKAILSFLLYLSHHLEEYSDDDSIKTAIEHWGKRCEELRD